jgi:hypothetical protein
MKKITLLILALFAFVQVNAQLWTINSCSNLGSTTYGPMNTLATANSNSRKAVIYPSSQLTNLTGQVLNSMYFQRSTTTGTIAGTPNFKIYLKEVAATDWGASAIDWATTITGATLVYDSNPAAATGSDPGWKSFQFATNFTYSGTQNLAVFMEYYNATASTSISWNYEFTAPCSTTTNSNTTKYNNDTTGTLATSLASTDFRRPLIGFDFVVSCNAPNSLVTSNLGTTFVDVAWTENAVQPQNGYEYYYSTSNTAPLPATVPTGTTATGVTTTSLTSLTPATTYYMWVRGNCGASDKSIWAGPISFTTLCVDVAAFVENFDTSSTGSGNLPVCWSKAGTSANVYNTTASVAPMSPANKLYMNISATTTAFAIMPPVSNLQANTHRLRFKTYCTTANKVISVGYFTTPGDATTYVELEPFQMPSTVVANTQEFTVIPTGVPAGITQLVFNLVAGAATTAYIDDVKWDVNSSCVEPSALTATMITNSSATLGWTNGGSETVWDIQYGLTGFSLGSGTMVNGLTNNSYSLSGLTGNTSYQFYVRGVCSGPENSSWFGPFLFKTQCDDLTDYFENFEAYPSSTTSLPDCWSRGGNSTSTYITTGSVAPMSPANRLYMFASGTATPPTEGYAIMPAVSNLQANTHRLKFQAYATVLGRFIEVGYLTNPADVSTFVLIQEVFLPGTAASTAQEFEIIPTIPIPAGVKHLAFKNPGFPSASTIAYIDNVVWEPIPACANPTAVSSTGATANTVSISWTSASTAVSWVIEYGAPGFTIGSGTIVPAGTNLFTLTGLMPQTTYQYYVRSICAGPLTSPNSLSGSFTTACAAVVPSYTENFATFPPLCWTRSDAGTATTGPTGTGSGIWAQDGFLNNGTTGAIKANLYFNNRIGWMISPIVDLTGGGFRVRFDVGATVWNQTTSTAMGSDDSVQFVMSTNGGSTWTVLETFNAANTPTNTSTTKVYDIPTQTSATARFAFIATDGSVDDAPDYEFFIDNFVVETPPANPPLCATNVVGTPNANCGNFPFTITWNNVVGALGYKINVGTTPGGTQIANGTNLGLVNSYSFATPAINTTYYYTVIPTNSIGDATGCTEQSLTTVATGCYCPSIPTSSDGNGITNVTLATTAFPTTAVTYFNHSATAVSFAQGVSANVQISFATFYTYNTYIWIDFNDDFTFETSELVYTGESLNTNPTVLNASFIMPATAALGTHRMRIVTADVLTNPNPCYSGSWGVSLDFAVNITLAPSCLPPSALTATAITATSATLGWTEMGTASVWDIEWGIAGFTPTGVPTITATTTNQFVLSSLTPNTAYSFYVRANCGATNGTSTWSGPFSFTTTCTPYTIPYSEGFETGYIHNATIAGCLNQQSVTANELWTANNTFTDYNRTPRTGAWNAFLLYGNEDWLFIPVQLDGGSTYAVELYARQDGSTTTDSNILVSYGTSATAAAMTNAIVPVTGLTNGVYQLVAGQFTPTASATYYVGIKGFMNFSPWYISLDDISITTVLSNDTFNSSSFVAYPNPVKDVLNLSYSSEISSVRVMNLLGQEVISRNVGANSTQLDMTNLTTGAYIVNVTIGDVVKSIKVIKQ